MLILHSLLFCLFSTSVVASPGLALYRQPLPKPSLLLNPIIPEEAPDIPEEAYGRWYRLFGPGRPIIPDQFVNDVMLIDNPRTVKLFQLLDEPGRLHFEGTLQNHELVRFVGQWIIYPTSGDSKESRGKLAKAELIGRKFTITIDLLIPFREGLRLHVDFNDCWYRLYNDDTPVDNFDDLMQIQGSNTGHSSIDLYALPNPVDGLSQLTHMYEMVTEHDLITLAGPWKRYPTVGVYCNLTIFQWLTSDVLETVDFRFSSLPCCR